MTQTEEIHSLIHAWERNILTTGEFHGRMSDCVQKLPSAEVGAALEARAGHAHEDIRRAAVEFQVIHRHEEMSKNLDFVRQNSPLRPQIRLELFGGYDYYSSQGKPWWLNGREYYQATFLGFASRGENMFPVGLVEFDVVIDVPGHRGRYGILLATPSLDSVAWGQTEDEVVVYVVEALPDDLAAVCSADASGQAIETHATYRVEGATRPPL